MSRAITIIKGMFKYACSNGLSDRPMRFGAGFEKPLAALKRKARQAADLANGKRPFGPGDILRLVENAGGPLRAMILLGINGGMGNTDCARLPLRAVDLDGMVIEFNRPKTGVERMVPFWPETVAALREAVETRPRPADGAAERLVFLTRHGRPWVRENVHRTQDNGIAGNRGARRAHLGGMIGT